MLRTVAGRLLATGRVGLLPSAFNPPTVAHVAIADVAQERFALDQVVFVLTEAMPHKRIDRPGPEERLRWLRAIARERPDRAVTACGVGLVIDIAEAFRGDLGPACEIFVLAGRDAAERFASWDYGDGMPFAEQLRHYRLLVASRDGDYDVPAEHAGRILPFSIGARYNEASSRAVREAVRRGDGWDHIVPAAIRDAIGAAYSEVRA